VHSYLPAEHIPDVLLHTAAVDAVLEAEPDAAVVDMHGLATDCLSLRILQTKAGSPAADVSAADIQHLLVVFGSSVDHIAAVIVLALAHTAGKLVVLALVAEDMSSDAEPGVRYTSSDAEPVAEDMSFVAVSGRSCLLAALADYTQSGDQDQ